MGDLNTNYKKSTVVSVVAALLLITGVTGGALYALNHKNGKAAEGPAVEAGSMTPQVKAATVIHFRADKNQTVLNQLKSREKVVVQEDPDGDIVESINGIKNGTNNKYWSYYVDGSIGKISAGQYTTKGGEDIVWKFE